MKKNKRCKKQKGITLIALVVTIIVLLILAGVSIGALTGDSGIIDQAHTAKENTEIASWEEQIDLAIIDAENKHRNPTLDDVKEELKNKGVIDDYSQVDKDGLITTNKPVYEIAGKLDDYVPFGPGKFANKNEEYTDETSEEEYKTVTVPEGFKILEEASKIDEGLVIEDKNGSQFVWIPVSDINDMAQCANVSATSLCDLELQGNELKCNTHNSTEIVGKLYATSTGENFGTVNTTYKPNSGLREPAVVTYNPSGTGTKYDGDTNNLSIIKENYTTEEFLKDLKIQYKEMATSVAKYKGFYVGRYELGLEGDIPVSKNASTNSSTVTTASAGNSKTNKWYGLYKKCLEYTVPETSKSSVTSSMIWGSQYDAMMNWMEDEAKRIDKNKLNNSYVTGYAEDKDYIKNVFDLFGCHREWTLEADSVERVWRGSCWDSYGRSTSYRGHEKTDTNYDVSVRSTRFTIYIK